MVRRFHSKHPSANLSRLQNLKPSMLGTKKDPTLRTKAGETFGLLLFSQGMATKFGGKFGPDQEHITRLVNALVRHMEGHGRESPCLVNGSIRGLISVECLFIIVFFVVHVIVSIVLSC